MRSKPKNVWRHQKLEDTRKDEPVNFWRESGPAVFILLASKTLRT